MALLTPDLIADIIEVAHVYSAKQLDRLERLTGPTRTPPERTTGPGMTNKSANKGTP